MTSSQEELTNFKNESENQIAELRKENTSLSSCLKTCNENLEKSKTESKIKVAQIFLRFSIYFILNQIFYKD